jgi:peptidyl-prolyl cis-trans isomerase SurA
MREDAYVEIKPGYSDTGASGNQRVLPITYASYTPPSPKKKKKVERTRFRETTHTFRQKSPQAAAAPAQTPAPAPPEKKNAKTAKAADLAMKPGKKEKIRFGQAPSKTLPNGPESPTEDAGAVPQVAQNNEPPNPLEPAAAPEKKTRFSNRAKAPKQPKAGGPKVDPLAPAAPDAAEVADRQTQSAPLGLAGDTASKKKKGTTTTGDKTRLSDKKKQESQQSSQAPADPTPIPAVQGAPAPAPAAPTAPPQ